MIFVFTYTENLRLGRCCFPEYETTEKTQGSFSSSRLEWSKTCHGQVGPEIFYALFSMRNAQPGFSKWNTGLQKSTEQFTISTIILRISVNWKIHKDAKSFQISMSKAIDGLSDPARWECLVR